MADVNKLAPFILKWEGGFVNDPDDLGGATNMGVTIETHENPAVAKSDGANMLKLDLLEGLLTRLVRIREAIK